MTRVESASNPDTTTAQVVPDAVCTFCGCLCDDIELTVVARQIVAARRACRAGRSLVPAAGRRRSPQLPDCRPPGARGRGNRAGRGDPGGSPLSAGLWAGRYDLRNPAGGRGIADWLGGSSTPRPACSTDRPG